MRSASVASMCCLNVTVTGSLETGAVQAALRELDHQRRRQRERAVGQLARVRDGQRRVARRADHGRRGVGRVVLRDARREGAEGRVGAHRQRERRRHGAADAAARDVRDPEALQLGRLAAGGDLERRVAGARGLRVVALVEAEVVVVLDGEVAVREQADALGLVVVVAELVRGRATASSTTGVTPAALVDSSSGFSPLTARVAGDVGRAREVDRDRRASGPRPGSR